jgi:hypothetical protein
VVGARDFSLVHNIQTGSGAHPASYMISRIKIFILSFTFGTLDLKIIDVAGLSGIELQIQGKLIMKDFRFSQWWLQRVLFSGI